MFYNHGTSELTVTNPNNTDNAKYLASLDAVSDGGTIKCWVIDPAAVRRPLSGLRSDQHHRLRVALRRRPMTTCAVQTSWTLTQELDNVGASIGGGLWGFGLPAGEITANLSVDARWATYVMESDFLPSDFVNCTGLRMCLANGTPHRCAGCRTPMLPSMSRTTSTKARWN